MENKHTLYHEKDCLKTFCISLRERAKNIIDFEKKKVWGTIECIGKNKEKCKTFSVAIKK